MKTKSLLMVILTVLFVVASMPLNASEYGPTREARHSPEFLLQSSDLSDRTAAVIVDTGEYGPTSEGNYFAESKFLDSITSDMKGSSEERVIGEKALCFEKWETEALGERMVAACVHPRVNIDG